MLGTYVLCTSFRNPALLAKMAETLDEVSGGRVILGLGAGVFVMDVAVQAAQVTNLTRIYRLSETAPSRINSAFMVVYFLGGAGGSILGAYAWSIARWPGVCAAGLGLSAVALAAHLMTGRR